VCVPCPRRSGATPVGGERFPKIAGQSAAMCGAAKGELIARKPSAFERIGPYRHENPVEAALSARRSNVADPEKAKRGPIDTLRCR